MRYVIRSMSTTDFEPYSREPVRPYHIYLMRPELRGRAYWSDLGDAQRFDSYQTAEAEERRLFPEDDRRTANIVPEDDRAYPTYWEISNMNRAWKDTKAKALGRLAVRADGEIAVVSPASWLRREITRC